jgi:hypothetical protein
VMPFMWFAVITGASEASFATRWGTSRRFSSFNRFT